MINHFLDDNSVMHCELHISCNPNAIVSKPDGLYLSSSSQTLYTPQKTAIYQSYQPISPTRCSLATSLLLHSEHIAVYLKPVADYTVQPSDEIVLQTISWVICPIWTTTTSVIMSYYLNRRWLRPFKDLNHRPVSIRGIKSVHLEPPRH